MSKWTGRCIALRLCFCHRMSSTKYPSPSIRVTDFHTLPSRRDQILCGVCSHLPTLWMPWMAPSSISRFSNCRGWGRVDIKLQRIATFLPSAHAIKVLSLSQTSHSLSSTYVFLVWHVKIIHSEAYVSGSLFRCSVSRTHRCKMPHHQCRHHHFDMDPANSHHYLQNHQFHT